MFDIELYYNWLCIGDNNYFPLCFEDIRYLYEKNIFLTLKLQIVCPFLSPLV